MSGFFKKLIATAALLSIGVSSLTYANYASNACCPPPPSFDGGCEGNWCDSVYGYGSWLYWKVNGDGYDYAVEKVRVVPGGIDAVITDEESIHDIKFKWDSGFRIGLGFEVPRTGGWGFDLSWTHFDTTSNKSLGVDGTLSPILTYVALPSIDYSIGLIGVGQSAVFQGHNHFRFNVVDLEMGKWLGCGNSTVMFRPHVGLRFGDFQETFRNRLLLNSLGFTVPFVATDEHFSTKNRFKGLGVRAGLDTDLRLCDGWSVIGRAAGSLLWGRTHLRNHFNYFTGITPTYESEIKENYRSTRFITDLSLGLRYRTLACDCYPISLEIAWEHHYLFNQHSFWVDDSYLGSGTTQATTSWKKSDDVAIQGLTITAGIDF